MSRLQPAKEGSGVTFLQEAGSDGRMLLTPPRFPACSNDVKSSPRSSCGPWTHYVRFSFSDNERPSPSGQRLSRPDPIGSKGNAVSAGAVGFRPGAWAIWLQSAGDTPTFTTV